MNKINNSVLGERYLWKFLEGEWAKEWRKKNDPYPIKEITNFRDEDWEIGEWKECDRNSNPYAVGLALYAGQFASKSKRDAVKFCIFPEVLAKIEVGGECIFEDEEREVWTKMRVVEKYREPDMWIKGFDYINPCIRIK